LLESYSYKKNSKTALISTANNGNILNNSSSVLEPEVVIDELPLHNVTERQMKIIENEIEVFSTFPKSIHKAYFKVICYYVVYCFALSSLTDRCPYFISSKLISNRRPFKSFLISIVGRRISIQSINPFRLYKKFLESTPNLSLLVSCGAEV
jgi:hypothetical protein